MASADFPTALPDASTVTSGQTLLAADLADNQQTDRNELRALATKLGLGSATPARGKALIGSADGSSDWGRYVGPQLLRNASAQVNQRVSAAAADNAYGPDMWRLLLEASSAATLAQVAAGLPSSNAAQTGFLLTVGASNNNKFGMWQPIRHNKVGRYRGGTVSVQLKAIVSNARVGDVRVGIIQWTGTADNGGAAWSDPISSWGSAGTNPTLSGSWTFANTPANLSVPVSTFGSAPLMVEGVSISSTMKNLGVLIWCDDKTTTAADYIVITDIKLEPGSHCTEVDDGDIEAEEDACRDYYMKSVNKSVAPLTASVGNAWPVYMTSVPDSTLLAKVQFGRRMYGVPTVVVWPYGTPSNTSRVSNSGGTDLAAGSGTPYLVNEMGFGVQNNSGGSLSATSSLVNFNWYAEAPW